MHGAGRLPSHRTGLAVDEVVDLMARRLAQITEERTARLHTALCRAASTTYARNLSRDERFRLLLEAVQAGLGPDWSIVRMPRA